MDANLRYGSFVSMVVLFSACTESIVAPASPAAAMLGEWTYAAPSRIVDPPVLNTGFRVSVMVDSVEGMRFWGHVTLWFAGDVGISPDAFSRVSGRVDGHDGVMLEIPRASPAQVAVRVVGELAGDVLTIHGCSSGAESGPFAVGATFERVAGR